MNAEETCSLCREPLDDPKDRLPYRNGTEMTHVHARCALHATHALQLVVEGDAARAEVTRLRASLASMTVERDEAVKKLGDAAQSLETCANWTRQNTDFCGAFFDLRGYASSRATAARAALAGIETRGRGVAGRVGAARVGRWTVSRGDAATVRESKEKHPDQFCAVWRCLWRIKSGDRDLGPCRKHPIAAKCKYCGGTENDDSCCEMCAPASEAVSK